MPILPPEPFLYPPTLFEPVEADTSKPVEGEWLVIHTKARAEKALARWLLNKSVPFFLTLYKQERRIKGRNLTSYVPLFPGYVFVRGGADARYAALSSNCVANTLPVPDQDELHADLSGVYRLMMGDLPLTPVQELIVGTAVEVTAGPFAGLTGRVMNVGPRARLVVEVRLIKQGVSVELDQATVRPLMDGGEGNRARMALIRR